jgi:hypothetical protein
LLFVLKLSYPTAANEGEQNVVRDARENDLVCTIAVGKRTC